MGKLSGEATLPLFFCPPSQSTFFALSVDPFLEGLYCPGKQKRHHKSYFPLSKSQKNMEALCTIFACSHGIIDSANFRFLQRLYIIFGFCRDCPRTLASCRDYCPRKLASCRDCPHDSASCREPRQEAESHGTVSAGSHSSCTKV